MEKKEFKITSDGKEVATIECSEKGFSINCTDEGKSMCNRFCRCCQ